jgi:hypothetical protein
MAKKTRTYPKPSNRPLRDGPDLSKFHLDGHCTIGGLSLNICGPVLSSRGYLQSWTGRMIARDRMPFHSVEQTAPVSILSLFYSTNCHLTSKFQSLHRTPPCLCPLLERFTTLAPLPDARILPMTSCVNKKWPI